MAYIIWQFPQLHLIHTFLDLFIYLLNLFLLQNLPSTSCHTYVHMCVYTYTYKINPAHKAKCDFVVCHPLIPTFSPLLRHSLFSRCARICVYTHICTTGDR